MELQMELRLESCRAWVIEGKREGLLQAEFGTC